VNALEEVAYEAGRAALADQESLVAGVRQRTGTLLAAHALVASFLGAATIREAGFSGLAWVAVAALVLGLVAAAVLLAPWKLKFACGRRMPAGSDGEARPTERDHNPFDVDRDRGGARPFDAASLDGLADADALADLAIRGGEDRGLVASTNGNRSLSIAG
jgi:hypothetical protein